MWNLFPWGELVCCFWCVFWVVVSDNVCRSTAIPIIVETTGGIAPHSRSHCGFLAARSKTPGAVDRTRYGGTRISTKSFFVHHTQQMAKAAAMFDARAINLRVVVLKQHNLQAVCAACAA